MCVRECVYEFEYECVCVYSHVYIHICHLTPSKSSKHYKLQLVSTTHAISDDLLAKWW